MQYRIVEYGFLAGENSVFWDDELETDFSNIGFWQGGIRLLGRGTEHRFVEYGMQYSIVEPGFLARES